MLCYIKDWSDRSELRICMGHCSSAPRESCLFQHQEINPQLPEETTTHIAASVMAERSRTTEFNDFLDVNNTMRQMVKEKYEHFDDLWKDYCELEKLNEQLLREKENLQLSLRQRINNDSEMNHRSYQSSSEDVTSRNKRSDVLKKYQAMDGNKRRQAIEAFRGDRTDRTQLWYKKDLTCRIFVIAHDIARKTKDAFNQKALPTFFQCAPSIGVNYEESGALSSEVSQLFERNLQQSIPEELDPLFLAESFKVGCFSVLKEMAVSCDLTHLEKKMLIELRKHRDQWNHREPWLPYLDDDIIENMKSYIRDCVRIAWRMVNLLPPLKIVLTTQVRGKKFDEFFQREEEETKEKTETMTVCVWPALTDNDGNEVLVRGTAAIIPKHN